MGGGCSCKHVENLGVYWNFISQATFDMMLFIIHFVLIPEKIIIR